MSHPLHEALRSRLTVRAVLATCATAAVLWLLGLSRPALLTTAVAGGVTGVTDVVADAYDLRDPVEHAAVGAIAVVYAVATLRYGAGPRWLPIASLLLGGWFLLDAVQTVRHEGATVPDDDRDGETVYQRYVTRRVHEVLRSQARTRRELGEELDVDDRYLDTAVMRLRERDVVVTRGSELRVTETGDGWSTRLRRRLRDAGRRVARPVRMEFRGARESDDR